MQPTPHPGDNEGIVVVGALRSGTTLLRRLLDAHPNIACPPETYVFTALGRFLREDPIVDGMKLGPLNALAFAGTPPEETVRRLRELAFGFHRDYARVQNKPRWATKTAWDAFYLDEIDLLCGKHSQFVCVTRNGLDSVCSIQELCTANGAYFREVHEYVQRHAVPLEAFAHMWVDLTERIMKFAADHPDNAICIRYEDLVEDPQAVMGKVFGFLGEAHDTEVVERGLSRRKGVGFGDFKAYSKTAVDASSVGRSKSLSPYTKGQLGRIMNPTLVKCGYAPVPAVPARSDDDIRRGYEMGLLLKRPRATE